MQAEIRVSELLLWCTTALTKIQERRECLLRQEYEEKKSEGRFFGLIKYSESYEDYKVKEAKETLTYTKAFERDRLNIEQIRLFCLMIDGQDVINVDLSELTIINEWMAQ